MLLAAGLWARHAALFSLFDVDSNGKETAFMV